MFSSLFKKKITFTKRKHRNYYVEKKNLCKNKKFINYIKKTYPNIKKEEYILNCEDKNLIVGNKIGTEGLNVVRELKDIKGNVIEDKVIHINSIIDEDISIFDDELTELFIQCCIAKNNPVSKVHEFGYLIFKEKQRYIETDDGFGYYYPLSPRKYYTIYAVLENLSIPKNVDYKEIIPEIPKIPEIPETPEKPIFYPPEKKRNFFSWLISRKDPRKASSNSSRKASSNSSRKASNNSSRKASSNSSRKIKRISSNNSSRKIKRISSNNSSRKT